MKHKVNKILRDCLKLDEYERKQIAAILTLSTLTNLTAKETITVFNKLNK